MRNLLHFAALISLVLLSSCSCDDSEITGVEFLLTHSNIVSISNGVTTTLDGSDPINETNPSTVNYPFVLIWRLERTVYADENCIESSNLVTSTKLTCNKDFILDGITIEAGTAFGQNLQLNSDSQSMVFLEGSFSFEKGTHTFDLVVDTDDNQSFVNSITVDIQI